MDLTRRFSREQFERGLDSWDWIGVAGKEPLFTSPFGDVFLRDPDGGVWLLSTLDGTLTRPWANADAMAAELNTEDGQDTYLLAGLALGAERRGVVPAADEVYAFTVMPIIGGSFEVDNIQTLSLVVWLAITGQTHRQIRDLPEGTRITGFTIDGELP